MSWRRRVCEWRNKFVRNRAWIIFILRQALLAFWILAPPLCIHEHDILLRRFFSISIVCRLIRARYAKKSILIPFTWFLCNEKYQSIKQLSSYYCDFNFGERQNISRPSTRHEEKWTYVILQRVVADAYYAEHDEKLTLNAIIWFSSHIGCYPATLSKRN